MDFDKAKNLARAWIVKHRVSVATFAMMLFVGAAVDVYISCRSLKVVDRPYDSYFYDLESDRVFVSSLTQLPPVDIPGALPGAKPSGALANVFACHDCSNARDRYIGYVEIYTPEAKKALASSYGKGSKGIDSMAIETHGHLIAKPILHSSEWKQRFVEFDSPEGIEIIRESMAGCGEGTIAKECKPFDDKLDAWVDSIADSKADSNLKRNTRE